MCDISFEANVSCKQAFYSKLCSLPDIALTGLFGFLFCSDRNLLRPISDRKRVHHPDDSWHIDDVIFRSVFALKSPLWILEWNAIPSNGSFFMIMFMRVLICRHSSKDEMIVNYFNG